MYNTIVYAYSIVIDYIKEFYIFSFIYFIFIFQNVNPFPSDFV